MHVINRLYSKEFDFDHYTGDPVMTYMVASIPRSGSTYFLLKLWEAGCLGAPMEYANFPIQAQMMKRLGCEGDPISFWAKVRRCRTGPNGVYGYKMFMTNFLNISRNYPELLDSIVPDHVVYLTRDDIAGQAISYAKATQTRTWFAGGLKKVETTYDFDLIRSCEHSILSQRQFWENVFSMTGTSVHRVTYEGLLKDVEGTVRSIREFMGLSEQASERLDIPFIEKQRDEESEKWREMYECEVAMKGRIDVAQLSVSQEFELIDSY